MNIYKLDEKNFKNEMISFTKTYYGKIVFVLSYAIPFILLLLLISMSICQIINPEYCFILGMLELIVLFLLLIFFINGTRYYYKELYKYIETKK